MKKKQINHRQHPCLFILLLVGLMQTASFAQEISGRVIDKVDKTPLADVTIANAGNQKFAVSQSDGSFKIPAKNGASLTFSFVGYETLQYQVNGNNVTIELVPSQTQLGEVVVTALGIKRETKALSYSTQKIATEQVTSIKDNSGNFVSALAGKIAGAVVTTTSGGPGSSARIVLRGNKSISGNNIALLVIDGIVYDNTSVSQPGTPYSNAYSSSDGGANINPDDIESINVLKGPSAAALYGSRAVNGAIIITTKQGKANNWRLDVNSVNSVESVTNLPHFQDSYGRGNAGVYGSNAIDSWGAASATYPGIVRSFFRDAYSNSNTISASGGSEKVTSAFTITNGRVSGVVPENQMNRNNIDLRINTNLIKGLKTDFKLSYLNQVINNKPRLSANGLIAQLFTMPRDLSKDELSNYETTNSSTGLPESLFWSTNVNADNPYWYVYRTSLDEKRDRTTGLGSVSYQFTPWMNFMTRISFDTFTETTEGSFYNSTKSNGNILAGGQYYLTQSKYSNRNVDFLFTGDADFKSKNFQLNYVLGASLLTRSYNTFTNLANGLTVANNFSLAFATTPTFSGISAYKRDLNSVYGSVNLAMWESLYLDVTGRNDWSSTLPSPHSYFYPSVGLSFVMNKWLNLPAWIDMGKIRTSFTKVGNDADPNLLNQTYLYSPAAGTGFITRNTTKAISNLKPEQTNSFEAGLDLILFKNRVTLNSTYYRSNSINQLIYLTLPSASGFSNQYINAGNIENKGVEVQLQVTPIKTTHFTWQSTLNYARNISKVIALTDEVSSVNITDNVAYGTVVVSKGGAYGDLYGQKWKVDQATGKYVVNAKGLPVVEAGKKIGNFNPDATVGWINSVRYKNWAAQINIDGRIGGEMISGTAALMADYGTAEFTSKYREGGWVLDAVDESGNANKTAITSEAFWTAVGAGGIYPYAEFFTFDMTNFRVRNISLSYSLPAKLIPYVKGAQFSLSMNNALFLYKGKSILDIPGLGRIKNPVDPETSIGSGNFQGIEAATLPLTRTISLGVKLSF